MKRFVIDQLTPLLALSCALAVFIAVALDRPEGAAAAPAAAASAR